MLVVGLVAALLPLASASADTALTVAEAIATQDGSSHTVRGYVVGQPVSSSTVVTSDFPNDYAMALADSPDETNTDQMLYVQITSQWRSEYGLQSNPDLLGTQLDVTGQLTAYFSHPGLKSPTEFSRVSSEPPSTALTVAEAIATQDGSSHTVRGYVVGQPVSSSTVVTSDFPNDYAMALADSPDETNTDQMLYVQITSQWRSEYGLQSNPDLLGARLEVTGDLTAYFSHPGLKSPTAFSVVDSQPPGDGDPNDYYAPADGKTGEALRAALHDIIDDHNQLSYDQVWTALKDTDEDPNNSANVILLYSGYSRSKSLNGGDPDDWNREHTWAKSHGDLGTSRGPGTDVHHLRPTDVTVNSTRSNKDFDLGGWAVSECPDCWTDGDSFEPRDAVKGDVARMLFYMAIRYEGDDGHPDLELNNLVGNGSVPYHGKLSVLLDWHAADPPSAFEKRRNERIYASWQGNRNPFIDHPEWAASIWN